jgi:hypothetical protein
MIRRLKQFWAWLTRRNKQPWTFQVWRDGPFFGALYEGNEGGKARRAYEDAVRRGLTVEFRMRTEQGVVVRSRHPESK